VRKINAKASVSKKEDGYHRIIFVNPKPEVGPGDLAESLVNLRLFEDIFVENHKKGYLAMVKFFPGCEPKKPDRYIAGKIGDGFGDVVKIR